MASGNRDDSEKRAAQQYIDTALAPLLGHAEVKNGKKSYPCPVHNDRRPSFTVNPGEFVRIVWNCLAGCDAGDIRSALIARGADPDQLGTYGRPKRDVVPGLRVSSYDAAVVADAKRWHAVQKLPGDLNAWHLRMCVRAIEEGNGDLPGDPWLLLPVDPDEFKDLAKRAGVPATYRIRVYQQWMDYEVKLKRRGDRIRGGEQ